MVKPVCPVLSVRREQISRSFYQEKIQQLPQTEEGAPQDMEILSHPTWMEEKDENMADEEETFPLITPMDLPGKSDLMCECAKW